MSSMAEMWTGTPTRDREASAPLPSIPSANAECVVMVDGKPYAGFVNRAYAEMAVRLWSGEVDGMGNIVPLHERARHEWHAVRGRRLEIVERASARSPDRRAP